MPLRHKLFLIIALLTCVPLLVLLFGVVNHLETEIRQRTEKEVHVSLGKMAEELRLIIDNQRAIARGLIHDLAIRQFASVAEKPVGKGVKSRDYLQRAETLEQFFLNYQKAVPDIQALRFIDRHGKTLVKVKEGKLVTPQLFDEDFRRMFVSDQSNKAFFKQAMAHPTDVIMSDFELGQTAEDADFCPAMVRYTARIRDEVDREEGILVVNMWGTRLDATIEASLGGYPGQAYLVEMNDDALRDGIFLYHKDKSRRFADQVKSNYRFTNQLTAQEWQLIKTGKDVGTLLNTHGQMFFYRTLRPFVTRPNVGWLLVIEADTDTVLKPVYKLRQSIWWLLGILVLVSLISAVWVAWRMTKPVYELADTMKRYADGNHSSVYTETRGDEIGVAGRAFNYLTSRLKQIEQERDKAVRVACQSERLAAVGQLAAGIGHEINNPLMNMMSLAALIEDEVRDKAPQAHADAQILQKEGRRCAGIVQGILSFAREKLPEYREFDMAELILETLSLLQHRLTAADIHTVTELEKGLQMTGDPNQLQQVLVNLILNAVQASPEHAEIRILAHKDMDHIAVEIVDSGTGIEQVNMNKVFDPFFTTKTQGGGTGLGLSVSYGIVKRHNGNIYLENNPGAGLRVMILLPLHVKESAVNELDLAQEVMHVA
jgi:two-component system, NtrC family, sensor kinase